MIVQVECVEFGQRLPNGPFELIAPNSKAERSKEMIKLYEWCAVGFASMVTVLPNDQHETYKLKISTPAQWTYLCDEQLEVLHRSSVARFVNSRHKCIDSHAVVLAARWLY